jgi:RNA polymerase sigma-70 factor (ECF subfamily)
MNPMPTPVETVQRLFLRHANLLRGFVRALLPCAAATEDVVQETFLTLTKNAEAFDPGSNFIAWARATARLKVLEHYRNHRRWPAPLSEAAMLQLEAAAAELDEDWERRRQALAECLPQLAPRARELIGLRYSNEMPALEQIARQMAWTEGAVKVGLSRARKFLYDCMRNRLGLEASGG